MLLYLSLIRAVMGCSNAAPEMSYGERSPDNSNMASFVAPLTYPHYPSCSRRTDYTVQIYTIWKVGEVYVTSAFLSSISNQANLDYLIALYRYAHSYCPPSHSQMFRALEHGRMAFSLLAKPGVTNGSFTKTQSLSLLTPPRNGLHTLITVSQPPQYSHSGLDNSVSWRTVL